MRLAEVIVLAKVACRVARVFVVHRGFHGPQRNQNCRVRSSMCPTSAMSCSVTPPASCVVLVTVTRL